MLKIVLPFFSLVFTSINIYSQKNSNVIKLHACTELPTSLFADGYKTGFGIYATDYYGTSKDGSLVISLGYASWSVKSGTGTAGMVLPRIGYRQFLAEGFYLQGDAGVGIGQKNFKGPSKFVFGGCVGYLFKNKTGNGFDISARVNRGFNRTWIGLGAGYQFKL